MYIDTHAHLTDIAFAGKVDEVIKKSQECMVEKIITSGYNLPSSEEALKLSQNYSEIVYCSIGVYPENIEEYSNEVEDKIIELSHNKEVVAIGEIGLQYTDGMPSRDKQKSIFIKQLELAHYLKLPVVLHCRDAYGDMITLLKQNKHLLTYSGTFHCFSGSKELAKEIIKLGLNVSVGGVSTFKNAVNVKEAIKDVPLEYMLLETDSPYLAPHPFRGKLNSPSYIPTIAENLASLKSVPVEEVEKATTQNARRLFNI